jgi:hypothetical protein
MGLFSKFKDAVSEALPTIGGTVGMALGGPIGAAFGSGIGTLAQGRDIEDAMKNAAVGYGVGKVGSAFGFGKAATPGFKGGIKGFIPGRELDFAGEAARAAGRRETEMAPLFGIGSEGTALPINKGALGLGALALGSSLFAGGEEEENNLGPARPQPEGEAFGTVSGPLSGEVYEINDPEQLAAYRAEQARIQSPEFTYDDIVRQRYGYKDGGEHIGGGEVTGPGTGTSDSVPARLSDGEFVITAKAVNGAGGGDRDIGAARLYDMMADLEAVA